MFDFHAPDQYADCPAANDPVLPRTRTVPITSTITPVPGYPRKLVVFKMAASQYWQIRCWIAGKTYRRSARTTSLRAAQAAARQFYEELLARQYSAGEAAQAAAVARADPGIEAGLPTAVAAGRKGRGVDERTSFGTWAAKLYANEQARVSRGEFSRGSLQVLRNRLDAHILPRFAQLPVAAINHEVLLKFAQFLSQKFTSTTVSQYLIAVRKIMSHAARSGVIDALPEFPKIKVLNAPRSAFTPTEYWRVLRQARALRGQEHPHTRRYLRSQYKLRHGDTRMPHDLAWAVGFMVNAFIRPSDLKTLKHRHVEIVRGKQTYLRLTLPETKRHGAPIVTLPPAVRIYEQILKHQRAQGRGGPDDYLFLPHLDDRHYALSVLGVMLNWVLEDTGLKMSAHGKPRTLYCLRHSAITFRLLYGSGIDLLTLARNARTSIDVINKHYASTVTGEQNISMLQSRRTRAAQARPG